MMRWTRHTLEVLLNHRHNHLILNKSFGGFTCRNMMKCDPTVLGGLLDRGECFESACIIASDVYFYARIIHCTYGRSFRRVLGTLLTNHILSINYLRYQTKLTTTSSHHGQQRRRYSLSRVALFQFIRPSKFITLMSR